MLIVSYAKSITFELISFIVFTLTSPINVTYFDPKPQKARGNSPILLVHGYLHNSASWLYFLYHLRNSDVGPVYTINLGSPFHSIEEYAEEVRKKAQKIAHETGRRDLVLVGHSMGGLVSAYYATHLAPDETVVSVMTIGSPLEGTKLARFGIGYCTKQMRYQSNFTRYLRERIMESQIPFFHIGSQTDLIIRPTSSAFVYGPNSSSYEFQSHGHIFYLYSNTVIDKILEFYRTTSVPRS